MAEILLVEDMVNPRKAMSLLLKREGYQVEEAENGSVALKKLSDHFYDLMITDYRMKPMDGFELLRQSKRNFPLTKVILLTAFGSIQQSVVAMKLGAYDYLTKPCEPQNLLKVVKNALEVVSAGPSGAAAHQRIFSEIIGDSKELHEVLWLVSQVADTDCTVLIQGESGTGKEMVARAIHQRSSRRTTPMVAINCSALPETLLESELFGHARGAFTGAVKDRRGLFQEAEGGTLFLDEIADLSLPLQVKLLRVLQDGEIRRVGDNQPIHTNVRIIAATNKELEQEVVCGRFREDLFYRLNVIPIHMPALRSRKEDIPHLISHFVDKYAVRMSKPRLDLTAEAMHRLLEYNWPGNVRELENFVERMTALNRSPRVQEQDVIQHLSRSGRAVLPAQPAGIRTLAEMERDAIAGALRHFQYNQRMTAEKLGISTTTLWRKIKEYGIESQAD
ncbi:MAG TPA: sigma-54 dependent transcriptional regulator [bacterium]|nr:sigma-54 dependent transcriptional regulator [bacterium]